MGHGAWGMEHGAWGMGRKRERGKERKCENAKMQGGEGAKEGQREGND
jgi:hypothetical protein